MEIAEAQQGFFTALQAKEAGFTEQAQSYHVKMGNWTRVHRGIYKLTFYPMSEHPELMVWYLWAHDRDGKPEGVFSHETALGIHGLSDLLPSRLHMTVPLAFGRVSIPSDLVLHRGEVPSEDLQFIYGVAVTRPIRTILDLLRADTVPWDLLRQALRQAIKEGRITKSGLQLTGEKLDDPDLLRQLYRLVVEVSSW
jgi:predicted transcriptional regulator of viral defense system